MIPQIENGNELSETKVIAARGDGLHDLASEGVVALVLGEIEFYLLSLVSICPHNDINKEREMG